MKQTLFLGVATVLDAVGAYLSSIQHHYTAYVCFGVAILMAVFACFAAYIESVPKPHLVPVQYGRTDDAQCDGLVFMNDGEPAYSIEPPNSVPLSKAIIEFGSPADPILTRLSKNGGLQTFPITVKEGGRGIANDLRGQMVLRSVDEVKVSWSYADAHKPKIRRYTTECKLFPTTKGIGVSLESYRFAWWKW